MKKNLIVLVAVIGLSLTLSGCFKSSSQKTAEKMVEKTIESQTGGKVDVDTNKGTMDFKSDNGSMQVSTGEEVDLPDGFPKELVIASDAKIVAASSFDKTMSVTYSTDEVQTELFADYKTELVDQNWKKDFEMDIDEGMVVSFSKGSQKLTITIGDNSNGEQIGQSVVSIVLVN